MSIDISATAIGGRIHLFIRQTTTVVEATIEVDIPFQ